MSQYEQVIGVFGVPRSGTTWLSFIFDSVPEVVYKHQPLFSYAFKDRLQVRSSTEDIQAYFDELYVKQDDFMDRKDQRERGVCPTFAKKDIAPHLVFQETRYHYLIPALLKNFPRIKIVLIARNPIDVMKSWINAPKEFKAGWDLQKEWKFAPSKNEYLPEHYFGYYKWREAIKLFSDMAALYPDRVKLIRYEDLVADALPVSTELFAFCGLPMTEQTEAFLTDSQSTTVSDTYGVYRNKSEQKEQDIVLPDNVIAAIHQDLADFEEAKLLGYV